MDLSFIAHNISHINEEIALAANAAGRNASDITLLAVTKTVGAPLLEEAVLAGVSELGENKVQEFLPKFDLLNSKFAINWHFIGHLQTNKVKYVVGKAHMIHSVDSVRLASEISEKAAKIGISQDILVEINIADEPSKFGVSPDSAAEFIEQLWKMKAINVRGLMTVAPYVGEGEKNRGLFKKMRNLFVDINGRRGDNKPMEHLSMGMSGDFLTAISEGATIVRIGTGIFGDRH